MKVEELNLESTVKLVESTLMNWFESIVSGIPNFVLACIVLTGFWAIARFSKPIVQKGLRRVIDSNAVVNLLQTIAYMVVIVTGLFIALGILNLDKTVTSMLAGAGVLGLALGFAFQEIASNFVAGILIAFREPFQIGDIVKVDSFFGKVKDIKLRTTSMTTFDGLEVILPNKKMFTEPLTNFTTTDERRIDVSVGVSYSDNLERATEAIEKAVEKVSNRIEDKPVEVYLNSFGASSINFDVRVWIDYPGDQNFFKARHEMIVLIKKAIDENGFSIPFPIRTLEFDSGAAEEMAGLSERAASSRKESSSQPSSESKKSGYGQLN